MVICCQMSISSVLIICKVAFYDSEANKLSASIWNETESKLSKEMGH